MFEGLQQSRLSIAIKEIAAYAHGTGARGQIYA
jgi:hypothetical protein